jgi:SAM-dependent methyltransferase
MRDSDLLNGPAASKARLLPEGHPDLARRAVATFTESQDDSDTRGSLTRSTVAYLSRLRPLPSGSPLLVIGCGPKPRTCRELLDMGFQVSALEPVAGFADAAREYLGGRGRVLAAAAERIPLPDGSQAAVLCESILEHVESPRISLTEIYRVLEPGGVAWIVTTNKWRFSPLGRNDEFRIPFFNWFPKGLKEAYVYHHLHNDPSLANYSLRPAVHWFTVPTLCEAGRDVGFSRFYSLWDLMSPDDPRIAGSALRRAVVRIWPRGPWFRALLLTQIGGLVAMVKT